MGATSEGSTWSMSSARAWNTFSKPNISDWFRAVVCYISNEQSKNNRFHKKDLGCQSQQVENRLCSRSVYQNSAQERTTAYKDDEFKVKNGKPNVHV